MTVGLWKNSSKAENAQYLLNLGVNKVLPSEKAKAVGIFLASLKDKGLVVLSMPKLPRNLLHPQTRHEHRFVGEQILVIFRG